MIANRVTDRRVEIGPRFHGHVLLLGLLTASCAAPSAPAPALLELSASSEHLTDEVSGVTRVIELHDGRLAMVDPGGPSLVFLDVATQRLERFGRSGNGPGEFQNPSPVLLIHPDTVAVAERMGRRLLLFALDGTFVREARLPAGPFYVTATIFSDTLGALTIIHEGNLQREAAGEQVDSIAIMRGRPDGPKAEEAWSLGAPSRRRVPLAVGVTLLRPVFSDVDVGGVAADGRIFRVSAAQQTLQVWENGVVRDLGGQWGLPRPPITDADRDSVVEALSAIRIYRGIQPVFADQRTVLAGMVVAPDGEVWVELTAPREGKFVYRVIQADGGHRLDAAPPPGAKVVGIGRRHVFLARMDENGEQELLRAPRP